MKLYYVVKAKDIDAIVTLINQYINDGWELQGGIGGMYMSQFLDTMFIQAVVKGVSE